MTRFVSLFVALVLASCGPLPDQRRPLCSEGRCPQGTECGPHGLCTERCRNSGECYEAEQCRDGLCVIACNVGPEACEVPLECQQLCDRYDAQGVCQEADYWCAAIADGSEGG